MKQTSHKEELARAEAIKVNKDTLGGRVLIEELEDTIIMTMNVLATAYFDKSEHELRSLCATLKANLALYEKITGVDNQIENLKTIIKESENNTADIEDTSQGT